MSTARVTGTFTYKMTSGQEVEFDYVGIFYGASDRIADKVEDVCPSYGEEVPAEELEYEQGAIETAALEAALTKFIEEYPKG